MSDSKPHRLPVLAPRQSSPDRKVRAAIEQALSGASAELEGAELEGAEIDAVDASEQSSISQLMQVGELAKKAGKTVRAIHLYEELGLLSPADRSKGRYRLFSRDALVRVRWISKLQSLGLSLSQIQHVVGQLEGASTAKVAAARLQEVYAQKLVEARAKLAELRELERELTASLKFLSICDSACEAEVPVTSCPTCERHPEQQRAPELVSGAHNQ